MKYLIPIIINLIILVLTSFLIFKSQIFTIFPYEDIGDTAKERLAFLSEEALLDKDIPVSSVILYNNEIIGEGYNNVLSTSSATGHAELNAISMAIKKFGYRSFMRLDRSSLLLVSTFEPCPMCKGAMEVYKIENVKFMKKKPFSYWLKNIASDLSYEWNKRQIGPTNMQDSLFKLHPLYDKQKLN